MLTSVRVRSFNLSYLTTREKKKRYCMSTTLTSRYSHLMFGLILAPKTNAKRILNSLKSLNMELQSGVHELVSCSHYHLKLFSTVPVQLLGCAGNTAQWVVSGQLAFLKMCCIGFNRPFCRYGGHFDFYCFK